MSNRRGPTCLAHATDILCYYSSFPLHAQTRKENMLLRII